MTAPEAAPHLRPDREAYQRALPAAAALRTGQLIPINIDLPRAITSALAALPGLMTLRARIAQALPELDLQQLDELETYALATRHAHAAYVTAQAAPEALAALGAEGSALRDTLYADAVALSNRDLVRAESVRRFKLAAGHKHLAADLLGLAALLRQTLPRVADKTALLPAELDRANALGAELAAAVDTREQSLRVIADAAAQRQRMFSLFVRAYDQVRRAVSYLRWDEGDAEAFAPSLYRGRARRRTA